MKLLKLICFLLFGIFSAVFVGNAQQSSFTATVIWVGRNASIQLRNGKITSYPIAKNAFVNDKGVLVLKVDVAGKVIGNVNEGAVTYYAGDSSSRSALQKTALNSGETITYLNLYNQGATTRIYVPILRKGTDGSWQQLASVTLQYSTTTDISTPARSTSSFPSISNARTTNVTGSVLANGSWYKLGVSESGMYKIDVPFLTSMGINASTVNTSMIQLYGNGGGMLPQDNSASRDDDLVENAIYVNDDGNGIFDNNDYILFYAESPTVWTYDPTTKYTHELNVYTNQNFYFLTFNQEAGKRVSNQPSLSGATQTINTFDEHLFSETDLYNIIDSGREWYGYEFSQFSPSLNVSFNATGLVAGSTCTMVASIVGQVYTNVSSMSYSINNSSLTPAQSIPVLSPADDSPLGVDLTSTYTFNAAKLGGSSTLNVGMNFNAGNSSAVAHLNSIEVTMQKYLQLYGTQTNFRSSQSLSQATSLYSLANATGNEVIWDITDSRNAIAQDYTMNGSNAEFGANSSTLKEYIIFSGNSFQAPAFIGGVANQNLHDISAVNMPDMIIITNAAFRSQAENLATFRRNNDDLTIFVCDINDIFNEFSSGKIDVSAPRDFIRMVYNRGSGSKMLKYVLMFGGATYDYRNIKGLGGNYVPTYESRESLDPLRSYCSDDYFGFLDVNEGDWGEDATIDGNETLNIGMGRIPVESASDAETVINKIMSASVPSLQTNANWKNKITLVACDGNDNLHLENAEALYDTITILNKQVNINKIYIDAYPQESTPGGKTANLVTEAINQDIDDGTLIWNYVGHGGTNGLAQQGIVTSNSINSWTNKTRLPFFITATCEFGRFDKPGLICGAQQILLNPNGGSFGNLTSTRTVYANSNSAINEAFYTFAFEKNPDGSYLSLGDIMMQTKNNSLDNNVNNRNYTLYGDPSMKISYPVKNMIVTAINGVPLNAIPDTLKALSKVTIEGLVQDWSGVTLTNYTGSSTITVYDKPSIITTLGSAGSEVTTFKLQNNTIFDGLASVTNGVYKVSFVVPKDISYQYDKGKISLYSEETNGAVDAGGYLTNIVVGGSNPNAPIDNTPPTAKIYLNDPSFVSGGITRENPTFYADLSDANGINVSTAGIGHEITMILSNSSNVIILNKYYTASLDDYSKGKIQYPLTGLAPGNYTLQFKVWDTYNNSTEETIDFTVESTTKIQLSHVLNYPNPFSTNTTFHFDHNRFGDNLLIQIQIYTVSGKVVKTLDETLYNSPSHVSNLTWNGLDDFGDKIGNGVYVYKLKIRSLQDGSTTHVFQKLVLLN